MKRDPSGDPKEAVTIRPGKPEEVPQLVSLYNLMWVNSRHPLSLKMGQQFYRALQQNPDHDVFVVMQGLRLVGVFVMLLDGRLQRVILENVAVHPRCRRKGVGRRIVEYAVEAGRDRGFSRVVHVTNDRREGADDFYSSMGFERQGYDFVKRIEPESEDVTG